MVVLTLFCDLWQDKEGNLKPEHEWPSEYFWKISYRSVDELAISTSSESEDERGPGTTSESEDEQWPGISSESEDE